MRVILDACCGLEGVTIGWAKVNELGGGTSNSPLHRLLIPHNSTLRQPLSLTYHTYTHAS